jgi:hypothetical protein
MKITIPRFAALLVGVFFASYLIAFFVKRHAVEEGRAAMANAAAVAPQVEDEDSPQALAAAFEKSADRVTMGSNIQPEPPEGAAATFDGLLRKMSELPDGEEKSQLAQAVSAIRDRAAAPVLLDWAVITTDRTVLRSALDALGPLADAELLTDIRHRVDAAFRADDRYRMAKIIKNITNVDTAPALIELAQDATAPEQLTIAATDALATLATPPAVSVLFEKIEAAPPDETSRLATMISRIDRAEALPALQYAALGNKEAASDRARVAAIQALANFRGDDHTREVLQTLNEDPSGVIRDAASDVLARNR